MCLGPPKLIKDLVRAVFVRRTGAVARVVRLSVDDSSVRRATIDVVIDVCKVRWWSYKTMVKDEIDNVVEFGR